MKGISAKNYNPNGKILMRADLLNYRDLPLLIKLYMKKIISFQSGIQYYKLISAKIDDLDVKDYFKSDDLSALFGFGVDINRIHTSFRYNLGLKTLLIFSSDLKRNMNTVKIEFDITKRLFYFILLHHLYWQCKHPI